MSDTISCELAGKVKGQQISFNQIKTTTSLIILLSKFAFLFNEKEQSYGYVFSGIPVNTEMTSPGNYE